MVKIYYVQIAELFPYNIAFSYLFLKYDIAAVFYCEISNSCGQKSLN